MASFFCDTCGSSPCNCTIRYMSPSMEFGHDLDDGGICQKCGAVEPGNQQCPGDDGDAADWDRVRSRLSTPRGYRTGAPAKKRVFTSTRNDRPPSENLLAPPEDLPSPVSKVPDRFIPIRTGFSGDVEMFNLKSLTKTSLPVGASIDLETDAILDDRNGARCVTSISAELIGAISPLLWIREGTLDPQHVGRITVRVFNPSPGPIILERGTVVARLERKKYL